VTLTVSTHDAGGITEKDFALAAKADELAKGCLPVAVMKPGKKGKK
jgi:pterin-4a-carbinolamine dehydratase